MSKPRPLHFHLPVSQAYPACLRSVPADIAAGLARRTLPSHLLRAELQNRLDQIASHLLDHLVYRDSRLGDQVYQRQQILPIGSRELLQMLCCPCILSIDNVVRFSHGGWCPFLDWVLANRF